jgi:hypothetical protein
MITLMIALRSAAALLVGGAIGLGFGTVQNSARRRNEKRQAAGDLKTPWMVMPGSGQRVAYLLIALVIIQLICPLLFAQGVQWWVSGGLAAGYGWSLYQQLRRRRA